ncbi:DUF1775 domain-containing protein [Nitriliruptor alkaliphilus]|uniref:DUF1775 domain-containing protein n=1 Tax=Nitriliruptor alkaliphilus TaxID=427918 RepID=UPI0014703E54|nr:DUF1775 domain-containing protein [Nitriliruptor alkaliphilus]
MTVAFATAALVVAGVLPASAHPFFTDGATAPAGSLTTLTLAMAHGCGTEADAGGAPTLEVSIEVPGAFSYIAGAEVDGYEVSTEGDGPVPDVVTWTATDGGIPAPELELDVVVEGDPGDEVYVPVFQGCEDFSYRWIGTPDEPADDPAVRLTLGEPDPDAPDPPAPVEEPDATTEDPDEGDDAGTDEDVAGGDDEAAPDDDDTTVEDLPTEPPEDEAGGGFGWLPIVIGAIVLAAIGGLLGARRRPVEDPAAGDGTGMAPPSDEL